MNYTIDDIITVARAVVPSATLDYMRVDDAGNGSTITVRASVGVPLEKVKDMYITHTNVGSWIESMVSPIFHSYGGYVSFSPNWSLNDKFVSLDMSLSLDLSRLPALAQHVRDTQFYSVLEKALSSN